MTSLTALVTDSAPLSPLVTALNYKLLSATIYSILHGPTLLSANSALFTT